MIKVATWNINSIRARLERLIAWMERASPDVVCLQELKAPDDEFPFDEIAEIGYTSAVYGQPTYNGVAILSRGPIDCVVRGMDDAAEDGQARIVSARMFGASVVSIYAPNGGEVGSDKWDYKLEWLDRLDRYVANRFQPNEPVLLCGDFNVAPEDQDVANPQRWKESVLCHPTGRAKLKALMERGYIDTIRLHHHDQGPYSWWDYRRLAFPKGDGLRIDHILVSQPLADRCTGAYVDRDERKGKKPSDHAPVVAEVSDL